MNSGIYVIRNLIDDKLYVGCTNNFKVRESSHFGKLKKKIHPNVHLQNAVNKYGIESFVFEILEEHLDEGFILPSMENWWCNMLNTHNDKYGYNIKPTHPLGKTLHSEETKVKLKESAKKRGMSRSCIDAARKANTGRKQSVETRKKKSEFRKGKKPAPKTQKGLESLKNARTGVKRSKESVEKVRKALTGRKILWKDKIGKSNSIPILQYDLQGNFIKEWKSVTEAQNVLKLRNISRNLTGKCKRIKEFIFKYKNN